MSPLQNGQNNDKTVTSVFQNSKSLIIFCKCESIFFKGKCSFRSLSLTTLTFKNNFVKNVVNKLHNPTSYSSVEKSVDDILFCQIIVLVENENNGDHKNCCDSLFL